MEYYPGTPTEFEQTFSSQEACLQYLYNLRWPDGVFCPRCGRVREVWNISRGLYLCKTCRFQVSVTAGTLFQDTRKPLVMWFRAMWSVTSRTHGISALDLQKDLGLGSYQTAWTWLHKLRRAMVSSSKDLLSGTVETGTLHIGGVKKGERCTDSERRILVFVAAEGDGSQVRRVRLCRIADTSSTSLIPAIKIIVKPGSLVCTDDLIGYQPLSRMDYVHEVVRKDVESRYDILPLVSKVASSLKGWLKGTHHGPACMSHLDFYLDEFTFRFNLWTTKTRGSLFHKLMERAISIGPVTGDQIRGGGSHP